MHSTAYKIYTAVLKERLKNDTEEMNILPEIQAGFRKSRSTIDNKYMLQHIIETETAKPRGKAFTFFADFEAGSHKGNTVENPGKKGGQRRDNIKIKGNIRGD